MRFSDPIKRDTFVPSAEYANVSVDKGPEGMFMRGLAGAPCPCCGKSTIPGREIFNITDEDADRPFEIASQPLKRYVLSLHPVEKQVFEVMKLANQKYPNKNARELLDIIRPKYLQELVKAEEKVIEEIEFNSIGLDKRDSRRLSDFLAVGRSKLHDKNDGVFKRKSFINDLKETTKYFSDKEKGAKLLEIAEKLPTSRDNVFAFIVKHSQSSYQNKKERTSKEIIQKLMIPSQGSIEHIRPRHPLNENDKAGEDRVANYIWECKDCNTERANLPFEEFVETHPQMIKNAQRYMDFVINKLNHGYKPDYKAYPIEVAKTLKEESNGLIKLDTSRLQMSKQQAFEQISKRNERFKELSKAG